MAVQCKYCEYSTDKPATLYKHVSRKHPEHVKKHVSLPKAKASTRKLHLGDKRLTKEDAQVYREYLSEDLLTAIDDLYPAEPENKKDLFNVLKSTLRLCCPENVYHLICLDLSLLRNIEYVQEVLPVSCKCFCNLLKDDDDPITYVNTIINDLEQYYHYHTLVILKDNHTERTVERHFNAVYGNNQYRLLKINDVNHYINAFLYIAGRKCSKRINTHLHHENGFYLQDHQKADIYRQLSPMIPTPKTELSRNKVKKFVNNQTIYRSQVDLPPVRPTSLSNNDMYKLSELRCRYDFDYQ